MPSNTPPQNLCYSPGLDGIPVAESAISRVDGTVGRLEYRGIDIEALASESSFEETMVLLLDGELPNTETLQAFKNGLNNHRRIKFRVRDIMKSFPESAHPMDALQACIAVLGMFYPLQRTLSSDPLTTAQIQDACFRLIGKLPTLVTAHARMRLGDDPIAPRDDLSQAGNFLYMLSGNEPTPLMTRIMDVALIVHAEHTINASTFSTMVTASTMADPYTCISAAIGALSGPLHGGANEDVLKMLDDIGHVDQVESYLNNKLSKREKIPGLGHRIYKTKDPRAVLLQQLYHDLTQEMGEDSTYAIARRIEELSLGTLGAKGICPNVDFYSGIVYRKMGISTDLFTPIFAIARVVGWLAHWKESLSETRIYRPRQIYVGAVNRPYVPLNKRI